MQERVQDNQPIAECHPNPSVLGVDLHGLLIFPSVTCVICLKASQRMAEVTLPSQPFTPGFKQKLTTPWLALPIRSFPSAPAPVQSCCCFAPHCAR